MNFLQIPNGTGKTTLLSLIRLTLSNDWDSVSENEIRFKRKGGSGNDGHFEIGFQFNKENYAFQVILILITGRFLLTLIPHKAGTETALAHQEN